MSSTTMQQLRALARPRRNLSIYWQIVLLCAALLTLTIASSWLVAEVLSSKHKALLSARYGVSADLAHRLYLDALHQSLMIALAIGAAAAAAAGSILVPKVLKPFRDMATSADRVSEGDFSVRVPLERVPPECEVYALGGAFNRMAMRLDMIEGARKRMIADLSHDLLSPLTNLRGYVEGVRDGVVTLTPQTVSVLDAEIARLIRLLGDLNQFNLAEGRRASLRIESHNVAELLDETRRFASLSAKERNLTIDIAVDPAAPTVCADRDAVLRALQNILDNAIRYAEPYSVIYLSAQARDGTIEIACANTGETIPEGDLSLIFERFYRVDPARAREGGAGLGLAIARELVEAHDGRIAAQSSARKTRILMRFPTPAGDSRAP